MSSAPPRLVFMGTPDFAATQLQALLDAGRPPVAVFTQPDRPAGRKNRLRPPPVKVLALAHEIPVFQPRRVRKGRLARRLTELAPTLVVVAAYGRIVPRDALAVPPRGFVNVHASLLPRWRGAAPIHRAIVEGDTETGICLMEMEAGLDTGAVFACRRTPIGPDDTAETVHDRLAGLGAALLTESLDDLLAGALAATPQDEAAVTLAPPLRKEEGEIRWDRPARAIADQVRGLHPWPGAYTWLDGRRLKVFPPVTPIEGLAAGTAAGTLAFVERGTLLVASADGAVRIRTVQEQSRRRMDVAAFLAGHSLVEGTVFGREKTE